MYVDADKDTYMKRAYIICPDDFTPILAKFIQIKRTNNVAFYTNYTPTMLLTRFIHDRSLVFYESYDRHITVPGGFAESICINIGHIPKRIKLFENDRVHALLDNLAYIAAINSSDVGNPYNDRCNFPSISDTLSYDEMLLSALIGLSAYTRFINDGGRNNIGRAYATNNIGNGGPHEDDGIYMGLVGARLEAPGIMDYTTLYLDLSSDSTPSGISGLVREYINKIDIGADYLKILQDLFHINNKQFYKRSARIHDRDPTNSISVLVPSLLDNLQGLHAPTDNIPVYTGIDPLMFVKRLTIPAKMLLDDAVRRMKQDEFKNRKAYVVANGLGDGAWKPPAFGTEVVCFINVCAWLSLVFKPDYDNIPIIEYRRWYESTDMYNPDKVSEYIDNIITQMPGYNIRIKQLVSIKNTPVNSTVNFNVLAYSIQIDDNNIRYFIYRHSTFNFAKSVKSLCELTDGTQTYYKEAYKTNTALLVSMFAWDSNSYVGNEFWHADENVKGKFDASGDPAAACCSDITMSMNPAINTEYLTAAYANGGTLYKQVP